MAEIRHLEVRWRPQAGGAWQYRTFPPETKDIALPEVERGVTYTVEARAISLTGVPSEWAQIVHTINGQASKPQAPVGLQGEAVADGNALNWSTGGRMPAGTEYEIHRSTDNVTYALKTKTKALVYTDPVTTGQAYWYKVRAVDFTGGASDFSNAVQVTPKTVADGADVSTVTTDAVVFNPLFEAGDANWTKGTGWSIQQTAQAMTGAWCGVKAAGADAVLLNTAKVPVEAGQEMTARAYLKASAGANGSGYVGIQWLNAVGGTVSNSVPPAALIASAVAGYTPSTVQGIAPAGAIYAQIYVWVQSHSTGSWYVDNAYGYLTPTPLVSAAQRDALLLGTLGATVNEALDPSFESGVFWALNGTGVSIVTDSTKARSGNKYLQILNDTTAVFKNAVQTTGNGNNSTRYLEVNEGDVVEFGGWALRESGDRNAKVTIGALDKDKLNVTSSSATVLATGSTNGVWTTANATYTVPAGKKYVYLYCETTSTGLTGSSVIRFDDLYLRLKTPASVISEDQTRRFASDVEKALVSGVAIGGNWPNDILADTGGAETANPGEFAFGAAGTFTHPNGNNYSVPATAEAMTHYDGANLPNEDGYLLFVGADQSRFTMAAGVNLPEYKWFVAVRYSGGVWQYSTNAAWVTFNPGVNDCIVAKYRSTSTGVQLVARYATKSAFQKGVDQIGPADLAVGAVRTSRQSASNQLPFEMTFEEYATSADVMADWNQKGSNPSTRISIQSGGEFGGKVLRATGEVWCVWKQNIPFDARKLYKVSIMVRQVSDPTVGTNKGIFAGFVGVVSETNGVPVYASVTGANTDSSAHYGPNLATQVAGSGWTKYTFYWRGYGATVGTGGEADTNRTPGQLHPSVRYLRPMFLLNNGNTDGVAEIDHLSVEELGFTVGAQTIAAGAVGVQQMLTAPAENLIPNGYGESGALAQGRDPEGLALVNEPSNAREGNWCRKIPMPTVRTDYTFGRVPCSAGDEFYYELWAKTSAALGTMRDCRWVVIWQAQNADGTFTPVSNSPPVFLGTGQDPAFQITTIYRKFKGISGAAPAGATHAFFNLEMNPAATDTDKFLYVDAISARKMATFDMLVANTIQTSNYTEDGSGFPVTGVRIESNPSLFGRAQAALRIGPGQLQAGRYTLQDSLFKSVSALADDGTRVWYRGNIDPALGVAPDINGLFIAPIAQRNGSDFSYALYNFYIQSLANTDGLRYLQIRFYVGSSSSSTGQYVTNAILSDRRYEFDNSQTAANEVRGQFMLALGAGFLATNGGAFLRAYLLCRLVGVQGGSAEKWFGPPTNLSENCPNTAPGGGPSAGGSSGSTGGGTCVAPWTPVLMADGSELPAELVRPGMGVLTFPEWGTEAQPFLVVAAEKAFQQPRWRLTTEDGRVLTATPNHRVRLGNMGWTRLDALRKGDRIDGVNPGTVARVEALDVGTVVKLTVRNAQTYMTKGLVSHNAKPRP